MDWFENPWPGCLLRRALLDADGRVISETVARVPLDRDLQDAMDWAAKAYFDPSSLPTRPFPESLLRALESRLKSARPMGDFTGRGKRAR